MGVSIYTHTQYSEFLLLVVNIVARPLKREVSILVPSFISFGPMVFDSVGHGPFARQNIVAAGARGRGYLPHGGQNTTLSG